ncbi:hypothetical protein X777_05463 [Ooceraea biroi]|uniref:DNA-directed DNA polymerase n=1 Tax=Ooceraea biroi TaxID=2015173 RepID=A0A026WIL1_OOCBI|nr:hypothetical protein X777_05463 [Ooceraea biroi]
MRVRQVVVCVQNASWGGLRVVVRWRAWRTGAARHDDPRVQRAHEGPHPGAVRITARCHVCGKPFAVGDTRVRDHCHLTGRYRGPAHSTYNLNYKDSHVIPVIFHNLSDYDAHFIIEDVANAFEGSVELLPLTKERYIAFTKNVANTADRYGARACVKLRFIDSYKFLSTSLDKLASYFDRSHMRILRAEFRHLFEEEFQLLTRKDEFPYEYVDSVERLLETRLPPRESFHSSLTGDTVAGDDYAHATKRVEQVRYREPRTVQRPVPKNGRSPPGGCI